jgi:HK97 family phage major capsid protein
MTATMKRIPELLKQLEGNVEKAKELGAKASSESGLTDEDRVTLKGYREESEKIVQQIKAAKSDGEAIDAIESMFAGVKGPDQAKDAPERKSLAKAFVESPEYRAAVEGIAKGAEVPKGRRVDPVAAKGLFKSLLRTGSATAGGALVNITSNRLGVVDVEDFRPRVFRDLVDVQTSDSPLIEFVRRSFTSAAAGVAEATAVNNGAKPEAGHTFEEDSTTAKTIAHWEPVTRRMLNNVAQIMGIIESDLSEGLEEELDDQIVNGAGGADLTGILATSGIGSQSFTTDLFTSILKAKTQVRITGRSMPTAVVMSPEDMETVLLERYTDGGMFVYGGPQQQGPVTLWGVPAVESEVVTEGQAIIADWKKAKLYDVEAASIAWTDSHSDFFIRNIEVCRAELDVALAIFRPAAFVTVDLTEGS